MQQQTMAELMLYSTVKITALNGDSVEIGTGTGFFTNFAINKDDTKAVPVIITNKHVVQGSNQIKVLFHIANQNRPSGRFVDYNIDTTLGKVVEHPDSSVDLCAIPIGDVIQQAVEDGNPIFAQPLDLKLIPSDEDWQFFNAIENVTMIGYPRGIYDEVNNLPLVRQGITATSLEMPYNGKQEFMVDMACFPGSSGSPVFLYNSGMYVDRKNNALIAGDRLYLLGILYSGPVIANSGQLILAHPPKVYVPAMMHLGYVIKATQLHVLDSEIRRILVNQADLNK